jgi:hypothetical protein
MALIVLTSASGSPGVTTTALGMALTWSRPVILVDADPTGGSSVAAGYLRGGFAPPEAMIELALAAPDGHLREVLSQVAIALPGSGVPFVAGVRSHTHARTLLELWDPLGQALRSLEDTGQDVIVDAGRLGLYGSPEPVLAAADLALLVMRSDMVSLAGARSWAESLREQFASVGASARLGIALVGAGAPFGAREISRHLRLPVVCTLAYDVANAAVLSHGQEPPRAGWWQSLIGRGGWEASALMGSLRSAQQSIRSAIEEESSVTSTRGRASA